MEITIKTNRDKTNSFIIQNYMLSLGYTWISGYKKFQSICSDAISLNTEKKYMSISVYKNAIKLSMDEFIKLIEQKWDGSSLPTTTPPLHPKVKELQDSFKRDIIVDNNGFEPRLNIGHQGLLIHNLEDIAKSMITSYIDGITFNKGDVKWSRADIYDVVRWMKTLPLPSTWGY